MNIQTGVHITGSEDAIIKGLPHQFTCTAVDVNVERIEWRYRFFGLYLLLTSANNVNELTLDHNPSSVGMYSFSCVVISTMAERYTVEVPFTVEGKFST